MIEAGISSGCDEGSQDRSRRRSNSYEYLRICSGIVKSVKQSPKPHPSPAPHVSGLSHADADNLAARFKLLSDPTRLRMIYTLLESGEQRVGDLASAVESSESATSHQLRQLRLAGLVRSQRRGREIYYRIADTHIRLLLDVAVEHYLHDHRDHR